MTLRGAEMLVIELVIVFITLMMAPRGPCSFSLMFNAPLHFDNSLDALSVYGFWHGQCHFVVVTEPFISNSYQHTVINNNGSEFLRKWKELYLAVSV